MENKVQAAVDLEVDAGSYFFARLYAYDLLRRIFLEEPTVELIHHLQQDEGLNHFPFSEADPIIKDAIQSIQTYLSNHTFVAKGDNFENLHWDFTRLFIGPESPPAPPWESTYVVPDKLLFQECTNEVNAFYEHGGFVLAATEHEAADHIGFELDFLYHLSTRTVALIQDPKDTENSAVDRALLAPLVKMQLEFLEKHPLVFSNAFAKNIKKHAQLDFYKSFGQVLHQFLVHDKAYLSQFLNEH